MHITNIIVCHRFEIHLPYRHSSFSKNRGMANEYRQNSFFTINGLHTHV